MNEPAEWNVRDGVLTMAAPAGGDFFRDPGGDSVADSAPYRMPF